MAIAAPLAFACAADFYLADKISTASSFYMCLLFPFFFLSSLQLAMGNVMSVCARARARIGANASASMLHSKWNALGSFEPL